MEPFPLHLSLDLWKHLTNGIILGAAGLSPITDHVPMHICTAAWFCVKSTNTSLIHVFKKMSNLPHSVNAICQPEYLVMEACEHSTRKLWLCNPEVYWAKVCACPLHNQTLKHMLTHLNRSDLQLCVCVCESLCLLTQLARSPIKMPESLEPHLW